jgi:hypothetical protein
MKAWNAIFDRRRSCERFEDPLTEPEACPGSTTYRGIRYLFPAPNHP